MESVTLIVALLGSLAALATSPIRSLAIYLGVLVWYPPFLTVKLGSIDFTVGRVIILSVLANALFRAQLFREFKWNILDIFVVVQFLGASFSLSQNESWRLVVEREGGTLFDCLLPYFAARLVINRKADLYTLTKSLALAAIPLALLGCYQSVTGYNPFAFLRSYHAWGETGPYAYARHGFARANVTFPIHASFGLFFAALVPLSLSLWHHWKKYKWRLAIVSSLMMLGMISSMSSAPLFATISALAVLTCYPLRRHWMTILVSIVLFLALVDLYSNRHWYNVLTRFAYDSGNAYYRVELVNEAFGGGMTGHWLFGYGYVGAGPGADNTNFPFRHRDLVNIYVSRLATGGLCALIPWVAVNILCYCRLYQACRRTHCLSDTWLACCILAAFTGWNIAMMTVGALGQTRELLFVLIGICSGLPSVLIPLASVCHSVTGSREIHALEAARHFLRLPPMSHLSRKV